MQYAVLFNSNIFVISLFYMSDSIFVKHLKCNINMLFSYSILYSICSSLSQVELNCRMQTFVFVVICSEMDWIFILRS